MSARRKTKTKKKVSAARKVVSKKGLKKKVSAARKVGTRKLSVRKKVCSEECLIKVKYVGEKAEDGIMDARASGEALLGFDEMVRYAICKHEPALKRVHFELPVKVQKGSWEIILPPAMKVALTAFLVGLATQAAKDGLLESGPVKDAKKILSGAGKALSWFIRITKHIKTIEDERYTIGSKTQSGVVIEIINEDGKSLMVPVECFEFFKEAPKNLLERNTMIIEEGRELAFETEGEEPVSITVEEKGIYVDSKGVDEDGIVLPELEHGEEVELEGQITRTNEEKKTIGFRYKGHVLEAFPEDRNLEKHKSQIVSDGAEHIFSEQVKVIGVVDREDMNGNFKYKKPRIAFRLIKAAKSGQMKMFED